MEEKTTIQKKDKFNWKLVGISFIIIALLYVILSMVIEKRNEVSRETIYCHFEKTLWNDSVPRNECAILKIVSSDMKEIDMDQFKQGNGTTFPCSESIEDIPSCEGETYHYTEFTLRTFCEVRPCKVDGYICGAYYVTYFDPLSEIPFYEEIMFTDANVESEQKLLDKLDGCGK